jgi:flagellar export protein FliJ
MTFQFKEIKNYKKLIKEKEELKLVSFIKEREKIIESIKTLENEYTNTQSKIRQLYGENFNVSLASLYNDNLHLITEEIKDKEIIINNMDKKIEAQKIIIKSATIEFKKFEKLEENYNKDKEELNKYNEKKELDEIISIREFHKE